MTHMETCNKCSNICFTQALKNSYTRDMYLTLHTHLYVHSCTFCGKLPSSRRVIIPMPQQWLQAN